jgi:hypothetical protein
MDLKHKLEKQKECTKIELAADNDCDTYKNGSNMMKYCRKNKKRKVLVRNQSRDFHSMQEAAGMSTDLLVMKEGCGKVKV